MTRSRFAPSPTGYLHIGNARTAILNWLFARHTGGKFILRIEDTDRERSLPEYEREIIDNLHWLGVEWDEGPESGGDYGPYRQSERFDIYREYVKELLKEGRAFECWCTEEELREERQKALSEGRPPGYSGKCRRITGTLRRRYMVENRKPAIRFRVDPQLIHFNDRVRGEVVFDSGNFGDFVILRSDGTAAYNFAVVIDDALMKITHIIRGDDHISNTPRQILLYKAMNLNQPEFAHIPMILGKDRQRLSKRHGAVSVNYYKEEGYLPEAMVNYLSLLSWSSETGNEILSRDRLIEEFDFNRISKSPAVFDEEKLNWMNGYYIRKAAIRRLVLLSLPYLKKKGYEIESYETLEKMVEAVRNNISHLSEIEQYLKIFFEKEVVISGESHRRILKQDSVKAVMRQFLIELEQVDQINRSNFSDIMRTVQRKTGVKGKELWMPMRIALTGRSEGPELPRIAEIFGKEKCFSRISYALSIS